MTRQQANPVNARGRCLACQFPKSPRSRPTFRIIVLRTVIMYARVAQFRKRLNKPTTNQNTPYAAKRGALCRAYFFSANNPQSAFTNRESSPLRWMSLSMAA